MLHSIPYHKLFHVCLLIMTFLHLVSCPSAVASYAGPLKYNTNTIQKLADKNDCKSGTSAKHDVLWQESFALDPAAHEEYRQTISTEHLASFAAIITTHLLL